MLLEGIRAVSGLLLCALLSGCGTLYLTQAARGQWQILHARRPIDAVVADPHTPQTLRERLTDVAAARNFAVDVLHLPDNRSYRTYADIKRRYVVWNVVAAPEFSVEPKRWCFPIAGCVAYRGYFKESRARAFAAKLARRGYDVTVGGVPAYSTLGKFADPVLSTMMHYGDTDLVAIIFHELAHQLLYVKNDSEFNEAFATAVEDEGLRRWLQARGQSDRMQQFLTDTQHEREFVQLFSAARARLAKLYASGLPAQQMRRQKAAILAELADATRALEQQQADHYYEAWLEEGLNNAQLASVATYYQCMPGFERLLLEQGGDLPSFYAAARRLAHLSRAERHRRLCTADEALLAVPGPGLGSGPTHIAPR